MKITEHFSLSEFACRDGTDYPIDRIDEVTGKTWLESRLKPLCDTLEVIRAKLCEEENQEVIMRIDSGYRTAEYNKRIGGAPGSQHPKGRAVDIKVFTRDMRRQVSAARVHSVIYNLWRERKIKQLGGLGYYRTFTHVDVRPRPEDDHLARWGGERDTNQADG